MAQHSESIAELISEKIKVRYAEISERTFGSSNVVVDAYYPTYVRRSLTNGEQPPILGKRCSAISPFIANELGLYKIPIEDLVKMLGYKKQDIKAILDTVKLKNYSLVLVGLGGTGMNFMHWAEEICNFTNSINIFRSLLIYDNDIVDLTNIFRFPQILNPSETYKSGRLGLIKVDMIDRKTIIADRISKSVSKVQASSIGNVITSKTDKDGKTIPLETPIYNLYSNNKDRIFYGAPDIATREMMLKFEGLKFISATHGNDDCQLYVRPEQDSSMQIESYGMINLSVFFMNQLKMTIAFFELLASEEDLTKSKLIMEYSFAKEYSNKRINTAGLNRTYNFPINTSNFLDQEINTHVAVEQEQPENEQEEHAEPEAIANAVVDVPLDTNTLATLDITEAPIQVTELMVPPAPPAPPVRVDTAIRTVLSAPIVSSATPSQVRVRRPRAVRRATEVAVQETEYQNNIDAPAF